MHTMSSCAPAAPVRNLHTTSTWEPVMTRSEFVDEVARKADLPRAEAERVVNAIFDAADGAIVQAMRSEGSLSIRGFGRFTRRALPRRKGGNGGGPERAAITFE